MFSGLQQQLHPTAWLIIILIVFIFISAVIINLMIRKKYIKIQSDLNDRVQRRNGQYESQVLNRIAEDYKSAATGNYSEVNTQAIIEKCFNLELRILNVGERFVKHSVSLLIVLGLLGTFLGLTFSVGHLVQLLDPASNPDILSSFDSIVTGLLDAVSGMAIAFITSLFGIACSVILTVFNIVYNVEEAREHLMVDIEEYLDNTVALVLSKDKQTEYTMMNNILRTTFVEFGEKIENTLQHTVETFGEKLSHVVMEVEFSSRTLDNTVEKFDQSLKNFSDNIRDFSEFNFNLRNNIERMDVSFVKATEVISGTSKIIAQNYEALETFSNNIREASGEMTAYNKQVLKSIINLVQEVQASVLSIKELGQMLNKDMGARIEYVQQYEQRFNALTAKLDNDIKMIGEQTTQTFSSGLADNAKAVSHSISENMKDVFHETYELLNQFRENEKILAKTISMLPDQVLTYNEVAVTKIDKQLEEIKEGLKVEG